MNYLGEQVAHGHSDIQFLLTLTDQCLSKGFTGFGLAAHELPQKAPGFVGGPLADHKAVALPDQGCNNIRHSAFTRIMALMGSTWIFFSQTEITSVPALSALTSRFHLPVGRFRSRWL